jgi:hypothetical protein
MRARRRPWFVDTSYPAATAGLPVTGEAKVPLLVALEVTASEVEWGTATKSQEGRRRR